MPTTASPVPRPPAGLSPRARKLWRTLHSEYEFEPIEEVQVLELCKIVTTLDALDSEISERGMYVPGSQGQEVLNPALAEHRQQQALLIRIQDAIEARLDDGARKLIKETSRKASAAANKRWRLAGEAERKAAEAWGKTEPRSHG